MFLTLKTAIFAWIYCLAGTPWKKYNQTQKPVLRHDVYFYNTGKESTMKFENKCASNILDLEGELLILQKNDE